MPVGKLDGRPAGEGGSHTARMHVLEESDSGIVPTGRNQHQALDALTVALKRRKVNYVLDADIRGFLDHIDHGWTRMHRLAVCWIPQPRVLHPYPENRFAVR